VRIAVVGTGVSGLAAAWLLARRHEVHVVERDARIGGHTRTIDAPGPGGATVPVDTGFIVYNEVTYPLLVRLLDELGVVTEPSDMSWSLRCDRCDLEYAGDRRGIAAQPRNLADPSYLRMIADIVRFNRLGRRILHDGRATAVPIGRFLEAAGFGPAFRDHYLLPMAAAIWSSGTGPIRDFPLASLLAFLDNHGLLGVTTHHRWRTVTGGAGSYLGPLTAPYARRIHRDRGAAGIVRDRDGVTVRLLDGSSARFDAVVVATHADEALALLEDPSDDERELLGAWEYSRNDRWLHQDASLLPVSPAARASWNYRLDDCTAPSERVSLTYDLNRLQSLPAPPHQLVTLNPLREPDPSTVVVRDEVTHPGYSRAAVATQARLDELNGARRTFFVGAYQRWGFHEDGLWSAVRAAAHLGVRWPV
jgi:uncharacterized protein